MARTALLVTLLALTAGACGPSARPAYRPIDFGYQHDVTAEFERAEEEPPDVIVVPFENRTGLAQAATVVENHLLEEIRASGLTALHLSELPAGMTRSRSVLLQGRILEHQVRNGVHALRGAIRLNGGTFDSRWNWEARAHSLDGVPLEALADQINVKSMLKRDVVARRPGE